VEGALRYIGGTERAVSCDLSVQDCFGRTVTLEHSNWEKHRPRHPIVVQHHHGDIPTVLADPDLVIEQPDGAWAFYRQRILRGPLASYYLKVIIDNFGADGWKIVTAYEARIPWPMGTIRRIRRP
jgi:hypothetical protein